MSRRTSPHILLFNPDQFRFDGLSHLGRQVGTTPVIDELVAQDAVSFSSAFCQNPVCTPSRCSFMTGHYPHVRGHRTMFHMLHLERGEPHLLNILKENGYFVWWGGKNDLVPAQSGFEDHCSYRYRPSQADYQKWGHGPKAGLHADTSWRGDRTGDNFYSFFAGRLDTGTDTIYCDSDWANVLGAVDFIQNYEGSQPLCLFLSLNYPHPPYGVEEPFYSAVDRGKPAPRIPTPTRDSGKAAILEAIRSGQGLQSWPEERFRELRATYFGMCKRIDHQFGLILEALRDAGMYDDTAVFFFSDHGDYTGDYGLVEKNQNTFEDTLCRVPFVVKPPGGAGDPGVADGLVELVDLPATVCAVAGVEPGYTQFGNDLSAVTDDRTISTRSEVFCEGGRLRGESEAMELPSLDAYEDPAESLYYPRSSLQRSDQGDLHGKATMIRTKSHKYVRRLYEKDEVYDLVDDPQELSNRIDDPALADVVADLQSRMLSWYQRTCDVVPRQLDTR